MNKTYKNSEFWLVKLIFITTLILLAVFANNYFKLFDCIPFYISAILIASYYKPIQLFVNKELSNNITSQSLTRKSVIAAILISVALKLIFSLDNNTFIIISIGLSELLEYVCSIYMYPSITYIYNISFNIYTILKLGLYNIINDTKDKALIGGDLLDKPKKGISPVTEEGDKYKGIHMMDRGKKRPLPTIHELPEETERRKSPKLSNSVSPGIQDPGEGSSKDANRELPNKRVKRSSDYPIIASYDPGSTRYRNPSIGNLINHNSGRLVKPGVASLLDTEDLKNTKNSKIISHISSAISPTGDNPAGKMPIRSSFGSIDSILNQEPNSVPRNTSATSSSANTSSLKDNLSRLRLSDHPRRAVNEGSRNVLSNLAYSEQAQISSSMETSVVDNPTPVRRQGTNTTYLEPDVALAVQRSTILKLVWLKNRAELDLYSEVDSLAGTMDRKSAVWDNMRERLLADRDAEVNSIDQSTQPRDSAFMPKEVINVPKDYPSIEKFTTKMFLYSGEINSKKLYIKGMAIAVENQAENSNSEIVSGVQGPRVVRKMGYVIPENVTVEESNNSLRVVQRELDQLVKKMITTLSHKHADNLIREIFGAIDKASINGELLNMNDVRIAKIYILNSYTAYIQEFNAIYNKLSFSSPLYPNTMQSS